MIIKYRSDTFQSCHPHPDVQRQTMAGCFPPGWPWTQLLVLLPLPPKPWDFPSLFHNVNLRNKTERATWNLITAAGNRFSLLNKSLPLRVWWKRREPRCSERLHSSPSLYTPIAYTPVYTSLYTGNRWERTVRRIHRTPSGWKARWSPRLTESSGPHCLSLPRMKSLGSQPAVS